VTRSRLRLGVIGAGSWAVASHLPNLALRRDDVEFVGVARHGAELLAKIQSDWGFALASEDYRDVIAAGLDICIVASPTALHYEHARAALDAGASVLLEKPMTIEPGHAWELVSTAQAQRRHLLISFGWNHKPLLRQAKALMDDPGVGTIESLTVRMASFTRELLADTGAYPKASADAAPESRTWVDPKLSGGGYAQAQLSHALGAALWLTGLRGAEVFAWMSELPASTDVEFHDAIAIRYDNGAIGTVSGASSHTDVGVSENELDVRLIGSEGQFLLDIEAGRAWLGRRDYQQLVELPDGGLYDCDGPPNALVDLALGSETVNRSPGELGARTVEILAAAYRSASERVPIVVGRP
jgi:predicted dehydrogenase